ncbi:MAG: FAD-binding protein [Betaproteobacteria bacterium]|nr:FAD-binding protein [Betaproteobacteria bacterium]
MSPAPERRFGNLARAIAQWREILGPKRVLVDNSTIDRYGRTTLKRAPKTLAVLRPRHAAEVPKLLRIARTQRISLYPISRGRNWGWGEACPVTEGQVVLDLGDLDRILEINAELGYVVIEPGVTQGQLAQALAAKAPEWWLESTNAGAETSIVGNALERGLGVNDRSASVCGLEAVLADGTKVRTGFGNFRHSRVTHVAKWGVGPNLEGLFSQSNLGVVTRMGLWLAPKPSGAESCLVSVPASALPRLIDALRPLRLRGVLPTNVHVFPVRGRNRQLRWLAVGVIHGSEAVRAAHRREINALFGNIGRTLFLERAPENVDSALKTLAMAATPGVEDLFRAGAALCSGELFSPSPKFLLAYLGGEKVQKPPRAPTSADPLVNDYGLYFLWVTCPAVGRDVEAAIGLISKVSSRFGFQPQLTIQQPNGRAAVLVARICFNRRDGKERNRASRCYRAVLDATTRAGFPPWRLGIEGMSLLKKRGVEMDVPRRLKALMDPESVLAPGRYV